jgi:hypothetical protein
MLVSGWFLRKEFGMGLACVGFCMETYGNVQKCIEMSGKGGKRWGLMVAVLTADSSWGYMHVGALGSVATWYHKKLQ